MNDRQKINRAMCDQDNHVVELRYKAANGNVTTRIVSPVRWLRRTQLAFTAVCLGREGCRTFRVDRCESVELKKAADCLMPVKIETEMDAEVERVDETQA